MRALLLNFSLGLSTVAGAACNSDTGDGVLGEASEMQVVPGTYESFTLLACPGDTHHWLIVGTGTQYYKGVGPESENRQEAIVDLRDDLLVPIYSEFDSFVLSAGIAKACDSEFSPLPSVGVSDWADIDPLIWGIGEALGNQDLAEIVQVGVEAPIVPH